jgi:hypothetical protein
MKIKSSIKIALAFTLGYLLSLLSEQFEEEEMFNLKDSKTFFLMNRELLNTIEKLCSELVNDGTKFNFSANSATEINSLIKNLDEAFEEKNQWGDDSFLQTAYLSGRFITFIRYINKAEFDLHILERILTELLCAVNITVDFQEFYRTTSKFISESEEERKNSCDEIFYIISGNKCEYKKLQDFQSFVDKYSNLTAFALA